MRGIKQTVLLKHTGHTHKSTIVLFALDLKMVALHKQVSQSANSRSKLSLYNKSAFFRTNGEELIELILFFYVSPFAYGHCQMRSYRSAYSILRSGYVIISFIISQINIFHGKYLQKI